MGFIITPERKKKFDFAYFMWAEPYNMIVPVPGEEPRLFAFIRPFQPNVNCLSMSENLSLWTDLQEIVYYV